MSNYLATGKPTQRLDTRLLISVSIIEEESKDVLTTDRWIDFGEWTGDRTVRANIIADIADTFMKNRGVPVEPTPVEPTKEEKITLDQTQVAECLVDMAEEKETARLVAEASAKSADAATTIPIEETK